MEVMTMSSVARRVNFVIWAQWSDCVRVIRRFVCAVGT